MALTNFQRYRRIARFYDLLERPFERQRYRPLRPLMFRGLSGHILDAGVGTGRNFPFYPPGSQVVGIDLSPAMLARAERRRPLATTTVELRQMDVTRLDFPDRSFDAAVATFLFCTLPDDLQVAGMRELGCVVKPGGYNPMPRIHAPKRWASPRDDAPMGAVDQLGLRRRIRPADRETRARS